jgi:hypothetical protein
MPLQLFTEAVLTGQSLVTSGRMQLQPGVVEDIATHYAIVQGETMVPGFMAMTSDQWSDTQPAADLAPGPALAAGVTVIFRRSPRPAFETFTWSQEIEITRL